MDGFRVDLGALEDAAAGINSTLYRLQNKKVSDVDGRHEGYGHGHLADVVSDFCDRWEIGVEHLAKDGQAIADQLSKSVQAYLRMDTAAKGRMDGILERVTGEDPGVH